MCGWDQEGKMPIEQLEADEAMTSPLQVAILSDLIVSDPGPADTAGAFARVWLQEGTSVPEFVDALLELRDMGLIIFLARHGANHLFRLTENGRLYVNELIAGALRAMSFTGKIAHA
jgi:hypothetical protein